MPESTSGSRMTTEASHHQMRLLEEPVYRSTFTATEQRSEREVLENDPRWAQIQRIAISPHFAKSARLIDFLRFVAKETILGRGGQLNQQEIAAHVFDRRLNYDPLEDNIVRSHATRLRQRLDAYYSSEGKVESLRVSMMPGTYTLRFSYVVTKDAATDNPPRSQGGNPLLTSAPASGFSERLSRAGLAWLQFALLIFVSGAALYEWQAARELAVRSAAIAQSPSLVMHAFWSMVSPPERRTLIVPGDSTYVLYRNITHKTVSLDEYEDKSFLGNPPVANPRDPAVIARNVAGRRLTSIADLEMVARLLRIPEVSESIPDIRYARDLQLADMKESNAVFIGAEGANPWLSIYQPQINFEILDQTGTSPDAAATKPYVVNRTPRDGEQSVYVPDSGKSRMQAYGVIALVPRLDGGGVVLIVEGTTIAGTEAASEFVTDTRLMEPILAPLYRKYKESRRSKFC